MRLLPIALLGLVLGGSGALVGATSPPACELQLQDQYKGLVHEQLTPPVEGWVAQLTALVSQVRIGRTSYDIKKQQAELAEQNVAQLLEQLRLARQQQQGLQVEIDRLKAALAPPLSPPAN